MRNMYIGDFLQTTEGGFPMWNEILDLLDDGKIRCRNVIFNTTVDIEKKDVTDLCDKDDFSDIIPNLSSSNIF